MSGPLGLSGLPSPFEQRWCWAPSDTKSLDVEAMQRAAKHLVGTHDFTSFGKLLPGDPSAYFLCDFGRLGQGPL